MIKAYIDCNILIDWLIDQEPYSYYAAKVIEYTEKKKIRSYISVLTLANTYYIITKELNKKVGYEFLKDAMKLFSFVEMTEKTIIKSIEKMYRAFEDALHYNVAIEYGLDYIITRNKRDFPDSTDVAIVDAEEFIKKVIK